MVTIAENDLKDIYESTMACQILLRTLLLMLTLTPFKHFYYSIQPFAHCILIFMNFARENHFFP